MTYALAAWADRLWASQKNFPPRSAWLLRDFFFVRLHMGVSTFFPGVFPAKQKEKEMRTEARRKRT